MYFASFSPFLRIQILIVHFYDVIDYSPVPIGTIYQIIATNSRKYRTIQDGIFLVYTESFIAMIEIAAVMST
jgi:hypothetical protein